MLVWLVSVNVAQIAQFVRDPIGMMFNAHVLGPVGMDDTGRWWFCQELDDGVRKAAPNLRFRCEGKHNTTLVLSLKSAGPIIFGQVVPDEIARDMRRSNAEMVQSRESLILTGDKWGWRPDSRVPMKVVAEMLQTLGATTVADFYSACGFSEFLLRDEESKSAYLKLRLSERFGENPVVAPR